MLFFAIEWLALLARKAKRNVKSKTLGCSLRSQPARLSTMDSGNRVCCAKFFVRTNKVARCSEFCDSVLGAQCRVRRVIGNALGAR